MDNALLRCLCRMIRDAIHGVVHFGAMERLFFALSYDYMTHYGNEAYWDLFGTIEADIAA